jgi:putative oxidoreductase
MAPQAIHGRDWGLLLLRVAAGLMMLFLHGWGKLKAMLRMFGGEEWGFVGRVAEIGFPLPAFFASMTALAETLAALLLAAGLLTRYAAGLLAINMTVAVYVHLTMDPQMRYELAALYLAVMLLFVLTGPGALSVDGMVRNRK